LEEENKVLFNRLKEMEVDGLVGCFEKGLIVTQKGRAYVRNICMALDKKLLEKQPETQLFSSTI
jgi:oxygen-independent coproporphyrinogen-3 oxidase